MCEKKHKEELIWTAKKLKPQNQKAQNGKAGSRKVSKDQILSHTYYFFFEQVLLLFIFWTEVFNKILIFDPRSIGASNP